MRMKLAAVRSRDRSQLTNSGSSKYRERTRLSRPGRAHADHHLPTAPFRQWLVRSPDCRSKLSFSVQRQLSVQHDAAVDALLSGAHRSLAGMPQRHLLPTEECLEAWVLQRDWLLLDLQGRLRSRAPLPLTAADQIITHALAPGGTVRRAVLVKALEAAGYTEGSAEVAVHRTPYLQAAARGLVTRS